MMAVAFFDAIMEERLKAEAKREEEAQQAGISMGISSIAL